MFLRDARLADGWLMTKGSIDAFRAHALEAYPEECVGYVDNSGIYHRMTNAAEDRRAHAIPDPKLLFALIRDDGIRALCHSHPNGPDCPSQGDMTSQVELEIPFVIISTNGTACAEPFVWGDGLIDDRPLFGRAFRHGVDDCYAMIRAWWRQVRGVILPDFPRDWEWWSVDAGPNIERDLYRRNFASAGFYEIDASEAAEGDVWLAAIRSKVPNHAGIYLGRGLALHHAAFQLAFDPSRLSRRDPIARWTPYITHWLRRDFAANDPSSRPTGPTVR